MNQNNLSLTTGQTLCLIGEVGPRNQESLWKWTIQIIGETDKAVKITADGAGKKFAWLPKSVISDLEQNDEGLFASINRFGADLLRKSYIAKEAFDEELCNHLGYGIR